MPEPELCGYLGVKLKFHQEYGIEDRILMKESVKSIKGEFQHLLGVPILLSTKQVPDTLAVVGAGNSCLNTNSKVLLDQGFTLVNRNNSEYQLRIYKDPKDGEIVRAKFFDGLFGEESHIKILMSTDELDSTPLDNEVRSLYRNKDRYGIEYEDVWKVLQIYSIFAISDAQRNADDMTNDKKKFDIGLVKPFVWHGNKVQLSDKFKSSLIPGWNGKETKLTFADITNPESKLKFIYRRTFWGKRLLQLIELDPDPVTTRWAKSLQKKLDYFLSGRPHPSWKKAEVLDFYWSDELRDRKKRSLRLLEVLKTVNGMFLQRYLAFPEELWNWEKFDLFVLKNLNVLLDDEFLDGDLRKETLGLTTRYSELKKLRNSFKEYAFTNRLDEFDSRSFSQSVPDWLATHVTMYRRVHRYKSETYRLSIISMLSQTRCMGTPPPLVVHQSKVKALKTWQEMPVPLTPVEKWLINNRVTSVIGEIPGYVFEGLDTKAAISLTTSACIESNRREGGGTQAISDLIAEGEQGRLANRIDLDTGAIVERFKYDGSNSGDFIFWRCLEEVLSKSPERNREAFVAIVREPGKARTVTKGPIALRIVLDVINKICSFPLKKLSSSSAGMEKDAHGWQMFKAFFENSKETFHLQGKPELVGSPSLRVEKSEIRTYDDLFVEFTDYETATDSFHHEVGKIIMMQWFSRVGIPKILQRIAFGVIPQRRKIIFEAQNLFNDIGEPHEGTQRFIWLNSGFLMGDYLTKVILHIQNAATRKVGRFITATGDDDRLARFCTGYDPGKGIIKTGTDIIDRRLSPVYRAKPPVGLGGSSFVLPDTDDKVADYFLNQSVKFKPAAEETSQEIGISEDIKPKLKNDPEFKKRLGSLMVPWSLGPSKDLKPSPTPMEPPMFAATKEKGTVTDIKLTLPPIWPGVIVGIVDNGGFALGFIPKEARDKERLKPTWEVALATGKTTTFSAPLALGPDPEDHDLKRYGLRPVNIFSKEGNYISSMDDWMKFREDLRRSRGNLSRRERLNAPVPAARAGQPEHRDEPGWLISMLSSLFR